MKPNRIDVLVVGAGPTGTALAIDLARRGLDIRVIDKAPAAFPGSRAKALQPRSLELLEDLGVLDAVIAAGANYPLLGIHVGPLTLPWRMIRQAKAREDRPYPNTWMVPQFRTDAILHGRLSELRTQVEFGCELTAVQQDSDGVDAAVRVGSVERTIRTRYLVGADGGGSTVRAAVGIGFAGETDDSDRWLIVDAQTSGLRGDRWHIWPGKGGKMTAACPLPHTTLFQWMLRIETNDDISRDAADLEQRIRQRTGNPRIRLGSIHWSTVFRPNIRLAHSWRKGRVLLAGDAAHVHTPAGGQGLNTGMQDSYNLGWKLHQAIEGAGDALLDTYATERWPVADEMLARSTRRYRAIGKPSVDSIRRTADERQLELSYRSGPLALSTLDRSTGRFTKTLHIGDRAPDARLVANDGATIRLFDLFRGPHFAAIGFGPEAAEALARASWPRHGVPLMRIVVNAEVRLDVSLADLYQSFRRIYGLDVDTLLLIRPDGYVGLIATRNWATEMELATRILTGSLSDTPEPV